jgi:hypothetical protein
VLHTYLLGGFDNVKNVFLLRLLCHLLCKNCAAQLIDEANASLRDNFSEIAIDTPPVAYLFLIRRIDRAPYK